jgi:Fe2+ transport system protein B
LTVDADTVVQVIQVTGLMSVELVDDNEIKTFEIRTSTDEEQFIIQDECTQWIFKVRPLRVGNFPLLLKIGAVEVINGKERKRNIIVEKEINITIEKEYIEESKFEIIYLENERYLEDIKKQKEEKYRELEKLERKEKERIGAIEAQRKREQEAERRRKAEWEEEMSEKIKGSRMASNNTTAKNPLPKNDHQSSSNNKPQSSSNCLGVIIFTILLLIILLYFFLKK